MNAEDVFTHVLTLEGDEREAYLRRIGDDDPALRADVESLLMADESSTGFMEPAAVHPGAHTDADGWLGQGAVGTRVGPYRIVDVIARGGMGDVYLAERADSAFEMRVAIKLIRAGWIDDELVRRFETERRVLATLDHPNIARLFDGGITTDGVPYLVMEYVEGVSIDRYCAQHRLDVAARLALIRTVLGAVQHAHQHLIVHRDLKPSNILVASTGEPKLLDFGIAKVVDPAEGGTKEVTATASRILTPRYASPEQVLGAPVSVATDIYTIGVVLYELLTGHLPYAIDTDTPQGIAQAICEREPTRPSRVVREMPEDASRRRTGAVPHGQGLAGGLSLPRLSRRLSGDVDTILLKALQKDPERRYASVAELSEDIRRHLAGHPILARPDTLRYRATKFVRRNTRAVVATCAALLALVAAAIVSTALYVRADRAQHEAESQREAAVDVSTFLREMLGSLDPTAGSGRDASVFREMVDRAAERLESELDPSSDVAIELHQTIGTCYRALASYDEAEAHLSQALTAQRQRYGPGHPGELPALRALGGLRYDQGVYPVADSILSLVLERTRRLPTPPPDDLAGALDDLATVRERSGRADAESLYRESLRVLREAHGNDHPAAAGAMLNLGGYLIYYGGSSSDGGLEEAEQLLAGARDIFARTRGTDSAAYSDALHNLSSLYRQRGELDMAERLIRESLVIRETMHQPDHPEVLVSLNALASTLNDQGKYDEAETYFRRALAGQRRRLGEEHVDVGTGWNNLAGLLARTGRPDEAETCYERAVEIYRTSLGDDHAWVAIALLNLALLHDQEGNCTGAVAVLDECDRISRKYWPPTHFRYRVSESVRAACVARRGDVAAAEPVLLSTFEALEAELGPENRYTRVAAGHVAEMYEASGRPARAAEYR